MNADTLARVVALTVKAAIAPVLERNATLERTVTELRVDLTTVRERLAVAEAREPVPGPPGPAGQDGAAFTAGELECLQAPEDPRLITLQFRKGDVVTPAGRLYLKGMQVYCGVYQAGGSYEPGDLVTWNGSQWHCNAATRERPGLGNPTWTLAVKCGKDGKDAVLGAR